MFHLTQSQHTDTGPTSPSTDPITPGAWQGSHWSANFYVTGMTRPPEKSRRKRDSNPGSSALEADTLTTRPTRRFNGKGQVNQLHDDDNDDDDDGDYEGDNDDEEDYDDDNNKNNYNEEEDDDDNGNNKTMITLTTIIKTRTSIRYGKE